MNWNQIYNTKSQTSSSHSEEGIINRFSEIEREKMRLIVEENILLEKGMKSSNPDVVLKAHSIWHDVQNREKNEEGKSILFDPNKWNDSQGFKRKISGVTGKGLRRMSRQTPVIRSIILTRQSQVLSFTKPQKNKYDSGFVVRKKKDFFTDKEPELSSKDKEQIKYITNFLLNGGNAESSWFSDNFDTFIKKIVEDSLVLDAGTFEVIRNVKGEPIKFYAVDGETMRIADSIDDEDYEGDREQVRGYYPSYVQVIDNVVMNDYYPWELCYGIRNATTDINYNGYGRSELEDLVSIVTWMLYGDAYNGKFFTQGSAPRGLLKVSGNVNRTRLAQFRQSWQQMVAGVENAWKVPVIESDSMEWIDLQKSNADMQFSIWQEYLIKITCALYKIAPEEIGFNLSNAQGAGGGLFENGNESKIKFSKYKGLYPLLRQIEFWINKWIVNPINPDFEFSFVGLDSDTEEKETELLNKKVQYGMGVKEWRRAMGLPEDFEEGDFPLNSVYMQMKQQQAMAATQEENTDIVDQDMEDDDSYWNELDSDDSQEEETVKAIVNSIPGHQDNPMMFDAVEFFNKNVLSL